MSEVLRNVAYFALLLLFAPGLRARNPYSPPVPGVPATTGSLQSGRKVSVIPIEVQQNVLSNSVGESVTFKCSIFNNSAVNQNLTFTYYTNAGASSNSVIPAPTAAAPIKVLLRPNEAYSISFCTAYNYNDCEDGAVIRAIPIKLDIAVDQPNGYLLGNCVSHISQNASHHRSATVPIAGGRPF